LAILFPSAALASIGVGVGTGKIDVAKKLKTGGIYDLPPVTVFNTGTQPSSYTMSVTFNEKQSELKPAASWFSFSPSTFVLQPGQSQSVKPTVRLPLKLKPGKYFAYLEAHPHTTLQRGITSVGVAAATKLSFQAVPLNPLLAFLYWLFSLLQYYAPYSYILLGSLILLIVWLSLRKRLHIQLQISKK